MTRHLGTDVAEVLAVSPWAARTGLRWRPGVAQVASPMCQAVEWSNWIVSFDDAAAEGFLKIVHPDMADFVDPAAAYAGACAGMDAGVAPAVEFFLPEYGAIGFTYLPPPWRAARLDDLGNPDVLRAAIAAKAKIRRGPTLERAWDVFEMVRRHVHVGHRRNVTLPADLPDLLIQVADIGAALEAAGRDRAPCHNDGHSSNVLLTPTGELLLADFDCAGQADPHYDLAVLLNEAHAFEDGWRAGVEMHEGSFSQRVLNRCRAYAVADDLMWGLWGLILSATSPRRDLEFLKYGEWRLLRCRMALREPGFADRLHQL